MKTTALSFASLLALSVGIAAPAHAQEEGDDAGTSARPAEIVVTAQFREQPMIGLGIGIGLGAGNGLVERLVRHGFLACSSLSAGSRRQAERSNR